MVAREITQPKLAITNSKIAEINSITSPCYIFFVILILHQLENWAISLRSPIWHSYLALAKVGVTPLPPVETSASQGVFIWWFVKLIECHVFINPSRPSLSNMLVTVARECIDLNAIRLTLQTVDTPGYINVATVGENLSSQLLIRW